MHFLEWNAWILLAISLKFVPKGPINNIPALVQIMAWRRPGDKPLSEPMMVWLLAHICVTRPQWDKIWHCWCRIMVLDGTMPSAKPDGHSPWGFVMYNSPVCIPCVPDNGGVYPTLSHTDPRGIMLYYAGIVSFVLVKARAIMNAKTIPVMQEGNQNQFYPFVILTVFQGFIKESYVPIGYSICISMAQCKKDVTPVR